MSHLAERECTDPYLKNQDRPGSQYVILSHYSIPSGTEDHKTSWGDVEGRWGADLKIVIKGVVVVFLPRPSHVYALTKNPLSLK